MTGPDVLTIPQAARRLGKAPDTLRRLIAAGEFPVPTFRLGSRTYVSVRALDAFIAGMTSAVATAPSLVPAVVAEGAVASGAVASTRAAVLGEVAAARPERAGLASHAVTAPTSQKGA